MSTPMVSGNAYRRDLIYRRVEIKASVAESQDIGTFSCVCSGSAIDRDGDRIEPTAVMLSFARWASVSKMMPLAFEHRLDPEAIVGVIDPKSARIVGHEVVVDGRIDLTTELGRSAMRLVKSGVIGLSIGFLVDHSVPRPGGRGRNVLSVDLFEVSLTATPSFADSRILSWKSVSMGDLDRQLAELERHAAEHAHDRPARRR
jgi:HK97 family phage prohead protease